MALDNVEEVRRYHSEVAELDSTQIVALSAGTMDRILTVLEDEIQRLEQLLATGKQKNRLESAQVISLDQRRKAKLDAPDLT